MTTHARRSRERAAEAGATPRDRTREALLRDWIESLGPSAVVTFLTHEDYEREQRQRKEGPVSPPPLMPSGS